MGWEVERLGILFKALFSSQGENTTFERFFN